MSSEYLHRLLQDARVVELRHQHGERWESGTFDKLEPLEDTIRERADDGNLYTSLNRPNVHAINRMGARAICDDDIATICRVVFDLDPRRPAGTASTDHELANAVRARDLLVRTLTAHGWPMPALGMSGNGAHAVYRCCIVAAPLWRQRAAALYAGLRGKLRADLDALGVDFDPVVRNPGRIWRLYGSINRKGTPTPDRPHRRAEIRLPAGAWQPVKAATVERTAAVLSPVVQREQAAVRRERGRVDGSGDYGTLDAIAWFKSHNAYIREIDAGKYAVICPWHGEHTTPSPVSGSDTVIWTTSRTGWPTWHCSHAHCSDRNIRDVMILWGDADEFCSLAWSRDHG
jgi:hypothetical protein